MLLTKSPTEENTESGSMIKAETNNTQELLKKENEEREKGEMKFFQFKADGKTLDL